MDPLNTASDAWDFSNIASPSYQATITGTPDYPAAPNGAAPSSALDVFNSFAGSVFNVAKTVTDFQTATAVNQTNAAIAKTNLDIAKARAQAQLASVQAAIANPNGSLFLILAIVGIGIAFMQYAK